MSLRSQMLKGILEGCMLSIIEENQVYGYEISMKLQQFGLANISEGSIYPILLRLQKEKLIIGEMKPSPSGPKRKYYQLTEAGSKALDEFQTEWENIALPISAILNRRNRG